MPSDARRCKYEEGDWFAVPLRWGGYAVGLIARAATKDPRLLGYFFGPKRLDLPELEKLQDYTRQDAVLVAIFGDLGLIKCEWPVIGHRTWNRADWPMPRFARRDLVSGRNSVVEYDDNIPGREVHSWASEGEDVRQLPEDGLYGYGAVELRLTNLLQEQH